MPELFYGSGILHGNESKSGKDYGRWSVDCITRTLFTHGTTHSQSKMIQ
jgi:hypothetical protein